MDGYSKGAFFFPFEGRFMGGLLVSTALAGCGMSARCLRTGRGIRDRDRDQDQDRIGSNGILGKQKQVFFCVRGSYYV